MTLHVAVGSHRHKSMDPSRYTLRTLAVGETHHNRLQLRIPIQVSDLLYVSVLSVGGG